MTYTSSETKLSKNSKRPRGITPRNSYWRNTAANPPGRLLPRATKRHPSQKRASHPHRSSQCHEQVLLHHLQQISNDLPLKHLCQYLPQLRLLTTCPHHHLRMVNPRTSRRSLLYRHHSNGQTSLDSLQTPSRGPLNTLNNHTGTTASWTSS